MTISSQTRRAGPYVGTGSSGPFSFSFKVFQPSDMLVVKLEVATNIETDLTLTTDFTVSLNADQNSNPGGTITLVSPLAVGYKLVISSQVQYTQLTDLQNQGGFYPEVITDALDKLTIQTQQLNEEMDRTAKLPITSTADADTLVDAIVRIDDSVDNIDTVADSIVAVDAVAADIANVNIVAGIDSEVTVVAGNNANITTVATDIASVITVAADLNEPVSEIETVAGSIANVNTVGTNIANVNAVAGNATNINAVAGNATNINAVAGNATNINAVNANATNINAVAANETNIDTVAGINADVSAVAADAADIGTVATNIGSVNTVSTNIASVNNCSTNMAAIIDAPNQAAAAAASAAAAAASYDNFDDRYLGVKTVAPTVDNDGNPLVAGALYFNSGAVTLADKGMWVYDGAVWIPASAAAQSTITTFKFVATALQTTFSGVDSQGQTLSYIANNILVTLNGIILDKFTDYTATDGSSIVLGSAAALNDELIVYAYETFTVANTYTQSQTDALLALKVNIADKLVIGTPVPATGTAVDFTGIPSTAKRVTILFDGVSLSGSDSFLIQLGHSGGLEITGYAGGGVRFGSTSLGGASFTNGFSFNNVTAGCLFSGSVTLVNFSGNTWVANGVLGGSVTEQGNILGGTKTLSATLDRVTITRTGSNTFDAGQFNIMWE